MSDTLAHRLILVLALVALNLVPAELRAQPKVGRAAPDFRVLTTSGQRVSLENYRGYVLVLEFFATWCEPCRVSTPHLVQLKRKYGKQGLEVLGLGVGDEGDRAIASFAHEFRINYPLAEAGDKVQSGYGIRSVPVTLVIDRNGEIAETFRGYSDEIRRSMELLIKKLLADRWPARGPQ